jgi:hypothetical protein
VSKTFNQLATDFTTLSRDDSATNLALGKTLMNICIKKVLSLADWTFYRGSKEYTSVASQQNYTLPDNCWRVKGLKAVYSSVTYTPTEVKNRNSWLALNRVSVSSDIPQKYFIDEVSKEFKVYPIPTSTDVTYTLRFQKKIIDLSQDDYTTGTVTVAANSNAVVGSGTTWTAAMVGRYIQLNGFWHEITAFTDATHITIAEQIDTAVSGDTYTIAEMIPFSDGSEDLPLWYALWQYHQSKENPTPQAQEYERMFKEGLEDLIRRDAKSVTGILEKDTTCDDLVDINDYPQTIS